MKTSIHTNSSFMKLLSVDELLAVVPDLVFVLDVEGRILEYRAGCTSDLYLQPKEFLNKLMFEVLPAEPANMLRVAFEQAKFSKKLNTVHYQLDVQGQQKWFEARIVMSQANRFIMLVRDITVDKAKELQILHQVQHDHLTGLYNRSYAFEFLQSQLNGAACEDEHVALFYIDIDDFKKINDQLGHVLGDHVLKEVAQGVQASVRKHDVACRIGGDEFVVIACGEFTRSTITNTAKKILSAIDTASKELALRFDISVSVGVSVSSETNCELTELVKQADKAMYHAKHCGKHGFAIYSNGM